MVQKPLLRSLMLLTLVGGLQGFGWYALQNLVRDLAPMSMAVAYVLLILIPTSLYLQPPVTWRRRMLVLLSLGLLGGALGASYSLVENTAARFSYLFAGGILWLILMPFAQKWLEQRPWLEYASHFRFTLQNILTVVLALVFTGLFWALLTLGVQLFVLIKISAPERLLAEPLPCALLTCIGFAYAAGLIQHQKGMVDILQRPVLAVFKWLLPLAGLIATAFILALPFTGLGPLMATRMSASLMLGLCALLVLLMLAAYGDGSTQDATPRWFLLFLRYSPLVLPILASISLYALWLRVSQYGLTPERIWGLFVCLVVCLYAVGYVLAILSAKRWWPNLGRSSMLLLPGVALGIIALLSPLLSPTHLTLMSQIARLQRGQIHASQFDYGYLREDLGEPGRQALQQLAQSKNIADAATINRLARQALADAPGGQAKPALAATALTHFTTAVQVYPKGQKLPADFIAWLSKEPARHLELLQCHKQDGSPCDLLLADINADGQNEIVWLQPSGGQVFGKNPQGWSRIATLNVGNQRCGQTAQDPDLTQLQLTTPRWKQLTIGQQIWQVAFARNCSTD